MSQAFKLASSAEEVTLVPVLHRPDQPGAAIFIDRLQAMRMSSMISAVLFLAWFICRAAR